MRFFTTKEINIYKWTGVHIGDDGDFLSPKGSTQKTSSLGRFVDPSDSFCNFLELHASASQNAWTLQTYRGPIADGPRL